MANQFTFYVSASAELGNERAALARATADLPVTLGWHVVLSPTGDGLLDREALAASDLHVLLLGSDVKAPMGLEWLLARRSGRLPILFKREQSVRTMAASDYIRSLGQETVWRSYRDSADVGHQVRVLLAEQIIRRAEWFELSRAELEGLVAWREGLDSAEKTATDDRSTNASGVILSVERFEPSDGILLEVPRDEIGGANTGN